MPNKKTLISMARVMIAWAAFMTLVGVALTLIPVRAPNSIEFPAFRFFLFASLALVLHVAYDYWDRSHKISTFLTVVVLSAVTGAFLGQVLWSSVFGHRDPTGSVLVANALSSSSESSSADTSSSPEGTARPGGSLVPG